MVWMAKDSWKKCTKCFRKQSRRRVESLCGPCAMKELKEKRKQDRAKQINIKNPKIFLFATIDKCINT